MQTAALPPPAPLPALPLFAWTVPPSLAWWAVAVADPCQPVARELLKALARDDA